MESYEQKKRRLFGKQYLERYLKELNQIINKDVSVNNLLTIVETDHIVSVNFNTIPVFSENILFSNKTKLEKLWLDSISKLDQQYFIVTEYSHECGALKIESLKNFNINFSFDSEHTGLIIFISKDLTIRILLDFYEENSIEYLDFEIYQKS